MALTLNHSTLTAGTDQQQRLAAFDQLDRNSARKILAELRTDLQGKPGVLRLLHTSDASRAMKFQRASGLKQLFLSGDKLKRASGILIKLLKSAGVDDGVISEMLTYAKERGRRGLETTRVVAMLSKALYPTAPDTETALGLLGIGRPDDRRLLGEGGYGAAFKVRYEDQDHVLKLFHGGAEESRRVLVRDDQHDDAAVLHRLKNPPAGRQSFEHLDDAQPSPVVVGRPQPQPAPRQPHNNSMMRVTQYDKYSGKYSNDSMSSSDSGSEDLVNYLAERRAKEILENKKAPAIDPAPVSLPKLIEVPMDPVMAADATQAQATGIRLGRSNITHAMRLKDMPGVVQPKMLLVRERSADGTSVVHTVPGGAAFKAWARTRPVAADLVVEGVLMPMAPGKPLLSFKDAGETNEVTANVPASHMHDLGRQGLEILKGLQSRGFIHGDLKAENMLYDPSSRRLHFIDTDDLKKISKKPGVDLPKEPGAQTLIYLHPMARHLKPCGAGRDLFALGVTLLEASLLARGAEDDWNIWERRLMLGADVPRKAAYFSSQKDRRENLASMARLNNFPPESAEHFALNCIAEALEYEEKRMEGGLQNQFERYTHDNAGHPLNIVSKHPFLAGQ